MTNSRKRRKEKRDPDHKLEWLALKPSALARAFFQADEFMRIAIPHFNSPQMILSTPGNDSSHATHAMAFSLRRFTGTEKSYERIVHGIRSWINGIISNTTSLKDAGFGEYTGEIRRYYSIYRGKHLDGTIDAFIVPQGAGKAVVTLCLTESLRTKEINGRILDSLNRRGRKLLKALRDERLRTKKPL